MRRFAASALLLFFAAVFVVPLSSPSALNTLPVCCRTHGQHHCSAMGVAQAQAADALNAPAVTESCPYRGIKSGWQITQHFSAPASGGIFAEFLSHPAQRMQIAAGFRVSAARTHHRRGPPSRAIL